ncbi:helix-turn-helix domain-containing protein [Psychrosphaera sp. 1_MG-2023]|uniref:helix-turn-helix transcriptional regulator n=1 Tax=Psychrosphaera sp. 1_MG-2023 TaxID=3062643 RepID=UPI0026E19D1C|nr:helix-turn-helix domain-containing protein [Psychrosphaera sp. 1_MG-2023]MDO6718840.1 helix-turn-helix domain-containing protein [Psychrosphaera sp. 1_MG-2023]
METIRTDRGYQLDNIHVDAKPFSRLPTQQARTLLLVAKGLPQKRIAKELGVGLSTVKRACSELSYKFSTQNMRETVNNAIQQGVLRYMLAALLCVTSACNEDVERSYRSNRTARTSRTTRSGRKDLDGFGIV